MPVVAALAVVASGCELEVLNPGSIQDADLNTPELMPILVAGVSAEYNDIGDDYAFDMARLTDDIAGTGSYFSTQQYRQGIFDWEDSEFAWEQTHEAAWAAGEAWDRLQEVLGESAATSADAAKLFVLMGSAHLRLGENFCDVVYDVGPSQPRTAAFDSAIVAFQQAITIGQAAGSAGDHWVTAARGGIAAAYVGLGDWAQAVTFAGMVPTDFVDVAIYHEQANSNLIWMETHNRAEVGVWSTLAQRLHDVGADGVAGGGDDEDPRVPYTICGSWEDMDPINPDPELGVNPEGCTSGSGAHQGADGLTAHYRQDKYPERGSDIPRITGEEMRLIEAENFLRNNDFANFNAKITELRMYHGLGAHHHQATEQGSLDFPYATPADDGWSVLDEERYASLWLTGKRLWDMDRWNHPFLAGGFLAANVPGASAVDNRPSCQPVPKNECELNPNLQGDPICS